MDYNPSAILLLIPAVFGVALAKPGRRPVSRLNHDWIQASLFRFACGFQPSPYVATADKTSGKPGLLISPFPLRSGSSEGQAVSAADTAPGR